MKQSVNLGNGFLHPLIAKRVNFFSLIYTASSLAKTIR